jgi:hypothetical protein
MSKELAIRKELVTGKELEKACRRLQELVGACRIL